MKQGTILIVDRDQASCADSNAALQAAGYRTDVVFNQAAALLYLQARPDCQLVIANVDTPPTSGIALLDSISQEHPQVPVILCSTQMPSEHAIPAFRQGVFDFLPSPCETGFLIETVGAALEHGRMRRQSLAYRENLEDLISERTSKLRATMYDLERSYDITLEAMGAALDLRDAETEGHSRRVTAYTIALARAMRLPTTELKIIARGAYLHDIGKIAIPDAILLKPGKLTPEETVIMRSHCQLGYEMVHKIPFLADAAKIVHAHQESFDGGGYPGALKGDQIPLGARIFAIADTLDAMTSDRPYRKGLTFPQALAEIKRCSGTQFDPAIVATFLAMPIQTWSILRDSTNLESTAIDLFRSAAA